MGMANSYLSTLVLIHALLMLPSCSYGGRSIGATTISSSSAPFPFYILSSRLLELVPNRVGGGATPSSPKGNPPITYKPPGSPTPPPA